MIERCPRTLDDGTLCGGLLPPPLRGSHTGRWFQTCPRCLTTSSTDAPPPDRDRGPVGFRYPGDLPLTWQQRLDETED